MDTIGMGMGKVPVEWEQGWHQWNRNVHGTGGTGTGMETVLLGMGMMVRGNRILAWRELKNLTSSYTRSRKFVPNILPT